ncbi:asparagine synthase (glutamine-hydrolyzing) [Sediminibacterium roseum]|uniref:asparagine synthase (glutamine-hydrolyzing) n=1 Tax=Sediminibacterium roseum TaxID=1978412 RepID=A0ABW9ZRL7_9BACT|nr:asparagine synthase (glutamine-hydrolyzing) [Sediminibacterium roseum]NCI49102.1 asparagine synthase (glutamine-hydrolyzing) [Sediminibacterium roseum]
MCGIAGGIATEKIDLAKVVSCISHRGPDSSGCYQDDKLFLCHTRLSIQDLSANANQPMHSKDGRHVIIFNGEIYNHMEVRAGLMGSYEFHSTGDTETVLYAYIHYGADCLNKLNGIFAFAVYDTHTRELFVARDQLGVKPLYIYHDDRMLLFSSEIKTFLSFDIDRKVNVASFVNYLTFLWSPGELTPFTRVKKLLPGHYFKTAVNQAMVNPVKYYQIPFNGDYSKASESELIDLLQEKLRSAVKRQMLSDVPVGFFLSGGLDSSIIVALAKELYPDKKFACFTIDSNGWSEGVEDFADDLAYAKKVAGHLDVDLHIVKGDIDIVKDFDKMIWHLDEPQADAAPLNVLNISRLARETGIKVLLGGTGGDDVFSGYRRHQALGYEKMFGLLPGFAGRLLKGVLKFLPVSNAKLRRLKKMGEGLGKTKAERMAGYFSWLPLTTVKKLFNKKQKDIVGSFDPLAYLTALNADIPQEKNDLNQMLHWELRSFLPDHNLNYTDKMGMAVAVEIRVPFLDLELISFAASLPPELKMKGNTTKYLLKKVAERYLPHDVIYRPKTGFGAPVRKWITEDMDAIIRSRLSKENIDRQGIFDSDAVWRLIEQNKNKKVDASYAIWSILAIDSWLTQFAAKDGH